MKTLTGAVIVPFPKPFIRSRVLAATERRTRLSVSLLQPSFEREELSWPALWLARWRWRSQLLSDLAGQPDGVLADFGLTRAALLAYAHRPFWRA
jgi:uncharacterized protein YjiS (DUF1127 family)